MLFMLIALFMFSCEVQAMKKPQDYASQGSLFSYESVDRTKTVGNTQAAVQLAAVATGLAPAQKMAIPMPPTSPSKATGSIRKEATEQSLFSEPQVPVSAAEAKMNQLATQVQQTTNDLKGQGILVESGILGCCKRRANPSSTSAPKDGV